MAKTNPKQVTAKQPDKKTLSTNNYIAAMVIICVVSISITGYLVSIFGKEAFMQTKLIAKKVDVSSKYDKKVDNAKSLIQEYNSLGVKRDLIEHALPNTPDFPQIVSIIEAAGKSAGVKVLSISPDTQTQPSDVNKKSSTPSLEKIRYSVAVDGNYPKMISLLQNLEISARPMKVTIGSFKGSDSNLKVTLEIETAYQVKTDLDDSMKELE